MAQKKRSSTTTPSVEAEANLQIILAEYGHQHDKLKSSKENVNQSLTIYLTLIAVLVPVASTLLSVGIFQNRDVALLLANICLLAASASIFTLMRTYQARIEQTDAEKALSRLRNFIITFHPILKKYYSGPIYDDWATPYSNRWSSSSFWGWLALIFGAGVFSALSVISFIIFAFPKESRIVWWTAPLFSGIVVFCFCYLWIDRKLKYRAAIDIPRFPEEKKSNAQPISSK